MMKQPDGTVTTSRTVSSHKSMNTIWKNVCTKDDEFAAIIIAPANCVFVLLILYIKWISYYFLNYYSELN
jgi:hypothetical protein